MNTHDTTLLIILLQAAGDPSVLLRCLRDVSLSELVSVPVKGLEFAPAFGPSIDGVVIDPGDPEDQDYTLQVDTINTLNNILLRKDVVAKLSRYLPISLFASVVITREKRTSRQEKINRAGNNTGDLPPLPSKYHEEKENRIL